MMLRRRSAFLSASVLFTGIVSSALLLLSGCGVGNTIAGKDPDSGDPVGTSLGGILHGGPNPINNALMTLYTTTSNSSGTYGGTANVVTTTHTNSAGGFTFTLPNGSPACPSGEYAYVTAYGGSSGAFTANSSILLMTPIGLCDTYYSYSSGTGINTYLGTSLWIDEMTTAVSAYALGNFMTVTNAGVVNIGAPTNNHGTASASTPSAAGLGHAFSNALAIINTNTGLPNAVYTPYGKSATTGIIPDAELYLLGNILQACVNSTGTTSTPTATGNDGTGCGVLFSMTTPPQSGAAVPNNTMQAMLDLAKYPNPSVNNWNTTCSATGTGASYVTTATACLFGLSPSTGAAYAGALTSAPPDWTLAIVYPSGSGANTTATACTTAGTCPGLTYPFYVALDYSDNVFVLNYDGFNSGGSNLGANTWTNIVGFGFDGTPLIATPKDTTNKLIKMIGTDTAGHVFGANNDSTSGNPNVKVYGTSTSAAAVATVTNTQNYALAAIADPGNNIYTASTNANVNIRKLTYSAGPSYAVSSVTTTSPNAAIYDIAFNSREDLYFLTSAPSVYILPNTATVSGSGAQTVPTYSATGLVSTGITGAITSSFGIAATNAAYNMTSGVNAYALTANGATPISKSGTAGSSALSAGSTIALPYLQTTGGNAGRYNRYLKIDGLNNLISPDGDNGGTSGITFYDTADNLYLGTYEGCYVASGVCGTSTSTGIPMSSSRAAAIDSAGDIWVASGASANLTELIGAAAPTWPGLSMAKFGEPQ